MTPHNVMYVFLTFLFACALVNRLLKLLLYARYPRVLYLQPEHDWWAVALYAVIVLAAVVMR
jgi:hypothetical protein